jgi:hypothetical protein
MKKRVVVIGAGLCGSVLSTLLRNDFEVTLVEQGKKVQPLFHDVTSHHGEVNTSINRAEGLGGTTNYWHNALIELDEHDLRKAGIDHDAFMPYYRMAWSFFMSEADVAECDRLRHANLDTVNGKACSIAHMVLPLSRANVWELANERLPGNEITIVHGKADRIVPGENGARGHLVVKTDDGEERIEADTFLVCAGGLATPVLLAKSVGHGGGLVAGYHDHPMAYVAKIRIRNESALKEISCATMNGAEVRAGFVYEAGGVKSVIYIRPARNLDLKSITGSARYILSDLRNDPFSPKKIFQLVTNLDAVREAILFKSKMGFRGEYFSVLLLGEQTPISTRGLHLEDGKKPHLNWHVTNDELDAYERASPRSCTTSKRTSSRAASSPKTSGSFAPRRTTRGARGNF